MTLCQLNIVMVCYMCTKNDSTSWTHIRLEMNLLMFVITADQFLGSLSDFTIPEGLKILQKHA